MTPDAFTSATDTCNRIRQNLDEADQLVARQRKLERDIQEAIDKLIKPEPRP